MKCFVLNLHRCGTRSATALLQALGYKTIHWPAQFEGTNFPTEIRGRETDADFVAQTMRPLLDHYDAAADLPIPALYRQLFHRYPEAKFILLHRDPAAWARSVRKYVGRRAFNPYERVTYWQYFPHRPRRLAALSDEELSGMHVRHREEVSRFFAEHDPARLLVHSLTDQDCGSSISTFLGREIYAALPEVGTRPEPPLLRRLEHKLRRIRPVLGRLKRKLLKQEVAGEP